MSEQRLIGRQSGDDPRQMTLYAGAGLLLLLVFGLLLRTWGLSAEQPWWDEYLAIRCLHEPSFSAYYQGSREYMPASCPPLFLLFYGMANVGLGEAIHFRVLAVGFGMLTLVSIFVLGRKVLGTRAGILAVALGSVHFGLIYYSQEIREYPFLMLLTVLSSLCYVSMLDRANQTVSLAGCLCLNFCLLASHLMSIFFIFAQMLHLVCFSLRRDRRKHAVLFVLLHIPACLLWAALCITVDPIKMAEASPWTLTLQHGVIPFLLTLLELAGARSVQVQFGMFLFPWTLLVNGAIAAGVIAGVYTAVRGCLRDKPVTGTSSPFVLSYLIVWALLPTTVLYGLSWFVKPCFMARYVAGSSPAFVLLIVLALISMRRRGLMAAVSGASFIALLCVSLAHPIPLRGNFVEVSAFVAHVAKPDERVVTSTPMLAMMMSYYQDVVRSPASAVAYREKHVRFACDAPSPAPRIFIDNGRPGGPRKVNEDALRATGLAYRKYLFPRPIRMGSLLDSSSVPELSVYVRESP